MRTAAFVPCLWKYWQTCVLTYRNFLGNTFNEVAYLCTCFLHLQIPCMGCACIPRTYVRLPFSVVYFTYIIYPFNIKPDFLPTTVSQEKVAKQSGMSHCCNLTRSQPCETSPQQAGCLDKFYVFVVCKKCEVVLLTTDAKL